MITLILMGLNVMQFSQKAVGYFQERIGESLFIDCIFMRKRKEELSASEKQFHYLPLP